MLLEALQVVFLMDQTEHYEGQFAIPITTYVRFIQLWADKYSNTSFSGLTFFIKLVVIDQKKSNWMMLFSACRRNGKTSQFWSVSYNLDMIYM